MKTLSLAAAALCFAIASFCRAEAPATQPDAKINLLIVTGGHGHAPAFFTLFDKKPNVTYTSAVEGDFKKGTASVYDRPDLLSYDAVLLYDFQLNITPEEQKNFHALFDKGVGLIVLHHALLSFQGWPEYERVAGGLYLLDFKKYEDKVWPASTYKGDTEMDVTVVDKNHPVTAGVSDFHMKDEIYRGVHTTGDIHTLLSCEGKPLVWTREEKSSRVVTFIIGHGPGTWDNPNFVKLLDNSLHWVAKK